MYLNSSVQTGYPNGSQTVDGNSWVSARQCTDQNPQLIYLPAGWIGVFSENYKNGGYCGGSGWKYSAFTQATWSASTQACKNTSGTQLYNNRTHGQIWNGSGYVQYGGQNSPSVSN